MIVAAEETSSKAATAPAGETADRPSLPWYFIHTYSRFENKVQENLRSRVEALGLEQRVGQILVPTEDVVQMRNGKKVTSKRLLYPGYVLAQLDLDDDLWHAVKNTPKVTGFVGEEKLKSGERRPPAPLTEAEVDQILNRQKRSEEQPRPQVEFIRNDQVSIIDGPFSGFTGKVEEVNADRSTLKVMVTIFGRGTPVELEYFQVKMGS